MPRRRNSTSINPSSSSSSSSSPFPSPSSIWHLPRRLVDFAISLALDWRYFPILAALLLIFEASVSSFIILRVPYTEIDWRAYMQEVEGWVVRKDSPTNYVTLKGSTGPLVYPAGFLYLYRALRWIASSTNSSENCDIVAAASAFGPPPEPCGGLDVQRAQWVFYVLYLATQGIVLDIYNQTRPGPPWICVLLVLSKRLHSLFLLRLFNDCVAMFFAHAAVSFLVRRRYLLGSLFFSLSVSIKMNALLALPALGLLLLRNTGVVNTTIFLSFSVALQALLGAPFLSTYPQEYLAKAFEFSRVFFHQWTVNWKFVPEDIFISKKFALTLLSLHLVTLLLFAHYKWLNKDGGLFTVVIKVLSSVFNSSKKSLFNNAVYKDSSLFAAQILWTCVFVGIAFSRTLHFQFYSWYFHSIPFLLWRANFIPSLMEPKMESTIIKRNRRGTEVNINIDRTKKEGGSLLSVHGTRVGWIDTLENILRVAIFIAIEYAFNVVDQSAGPDGRPKGEPLPSSSMVLQAAHALLLIGLTFGPIQ